MPLASHYYSGRPRALNVFCVHASPSESPSHTLSFTPSPGIVPPPPPLQVNPGQLFEAEWATGHGVASDQVPRKGNGHFFTVVKAEDADMMVLISTTVLNDYIDSAPVEAEWLPTLKWDKRHLSWNTSQEGARNSDTSAWCVVQGKCASLHVLNSLTMSHSPPEVPLSPFSPLRQ